jgi:hypothetical protein
MSLSAASGSVNGSVWVLAIGVLLGAATNAGAQQTFNVTLGGTTLIGPDARVAGDVVLANRRFLTVDVEDFSRATIGGEWLVGLGPYIEAGAGVAFSRRTVPTVYRGFVDERGNEIEQQLRLRTIPTTFSLRLVPTGLGSPVQPYVGAGVGLVSWRYSEFGDFIDFGTPNRTVRPGTFVANGTDAGPVVLGGLRFAGDTLSAGGEIRYQRLRVDLDNRFAGNKLDLGGWTYQFTMGVRFGR